MATNLVWSAMVSEVLRNDNYETWSDFLKDYLLGQDLWDVITEPRVEENEAEFKTWRKKNAMALHAIKISCGKDILSEIKTKTTAKDAWDFLAKMHMPQPQEVHQPASSTEVPGPQIDYSLRPLLEAVVSDKWDAAKSFLEEHPDAVRLQGPDGCTILHEAVIPGHLKMVKELVRFMSKQDLEIQEINGWTALYFAAAYGFTHMAKWMVEKNEKLVSIACNIGHIPVVRASINGHGDMVRYLYTMTPLEELTSDKASNGATLLSYCIVGKLFDVALNLLRNCPPLAVTLDKDGNSPVFILSRMPSVFPSGSGLVFWQRWIYSCILIQPTSDSNYVRINIQKSCQRQTNRGSIVIQVFGLLHGLLSDFLRLLGVNQIYNQKLIHVQALEILSCICEQIRPLGVVKIRESLVDKALFHAVKHGIVEFVMQITKANSSLLWITDTKSLRSMFHFAVEYRQEKILSLIYGLDASKMILKSSIDRFGNNMLHLAGMLAPATRLDGISGAALQMQRELQWFKEVENIVSPMAKEMPNSDGQTPWELFTEHHRGLVNEGQKWMEETATSCTVVAALIVTIMFAAAFSVPGGNIQDVGFPIFLHEKLFKLFVVCDAISFLSSSTSIMVFLGILTSRYGEVYFVKSLPTKMIIGLSSLFISIASMTFAFCAALFLMEHGQSSPVFIPVILLSSVPVTLFVILPFPLFCEIFSSTFRYGIFNRKQKRWY